MRREPRTGAWVRPEPRPGFAERGLRAGFPVASELAGRTCRLVATSLLIGFKLTRVGLNVGIRQLERHLKGGQPAQEPARKIPVR